MPNIMNKPCLCCRLCCYRDGSASMTYCFKQPVNNNNLISEEEGGCLEAETIDLEAELSTHCSSPSSPASSPELDLHDAFVQNLKMREHWLWYEKQQKEDDYYIRNKQVL